MVLTERVSADMSKMSCVNRFVLHSSLCENYISGA